MVMEIFARAKEQGRLTPFGEETYAKLLDVSKICQGRAGDLAPLGVRQNE